MIVDVVSVLLQSFQTAKFFLSHRWSCFLYALVHFKEIPATTCPLQRPETLPVCIYTRREVLGLSPGLRCVNLARCVLSSSFSKAKFMNGLHQFFKLSTKTIFMHFAHCIVEAPALAQSEQCNHCSSSIFSVDAVGVNRRIVPFFHKF